MSPAEPRRPIGEFRTVAAGTIHLRQDGPADGRPVLLLHGFEGSLHWWDAVTPLLADTHRVIRVDLLGFGCTGGDSGFDQVSQGRMLAAVLDDLDVDDVIAVGHSWGADAALGLAELSERVGGIVIVDQAPDYDGIRLPAGLQLVVWEPIVRLVQRFAPDAVLRYMFAQGFAPDFDLDTAVPDFGQCRRDFRDMSARTARAALIDRRRALTSRPLDVQVRTLGLPTLVIHGALDQLYDVDRTRARYVAAGASFAVIDSAGHSPNIETPGEVATLIRDFAAEVEPNAEETVPSE